MLVSINILPEFSLEVDVTRSIPAIPSRLSSIFKTTPSSISLGEPPGSAKFIEIEDSKIWVQRLSYVGELVYELYVEVKDSKKIYDLIVE